MEPDDKRDAKGQVDKVWFTISDVAKKMGVHPSTIRRWEKEGVIPAAKKRLKIRVYDAQDLKRIEEKVFNIKPEENGN